MAEKKDPPYFMYFPGNYRWSAAFINMLGSAPYGGSEIGELHKIGALLRGKAPEDDEAWFDACLKVADGVRGYADRFDKGGHRHAASHAYLRACNYYQMAERFRTPKDKKALSAFKQGVNYASGSKSRSWARLSGRRGRVRTSWLAIRSTSVP